MICDYITRGSMLQWTVKAAANRWVFYMKLCFICSPIIGNIYFRSYTRNKATPNFMTRMIFRLKLSLILSNTYTVRQLYNESDFILTKWKYYLWSNAYHPCDQPSSVIWQHRNAPRWAWRKIRRHVVQVVRGRGHSSDMEQRANIKLCFKLGKTAAGTVELMIQVYGENCLSRAQIFRWYARFKSVVETIEDEARPGRPFSFHNEGLIAKVRKRIQEERCVTVKMMADEFGVNREAIR